MCTGLLKQKYNYSERGLNAVPGYIAEEAKKVPENGIGRAIIYALQKAQDVYMKAFIDINEQLNS